MPDKHPKWDYRVMDRMVFHQEGQLDALGREGWELVGVDGTAVVFKRPLIEEPEKPAAKGKK